MSKYTGTVTKNDLEGGFWQLHAEDGERYQLTGADAKLLVEGQRVEIEGSVQRESMGIGMSGAQLKVRAWTKL